MCSGFRTLSKNKIKFKKNRTLSIWRRLNRGCLFSCQGRSGQEHPTQDGWAHACTCAHLICPIKHAWPSALCPFRIWPRAGAQWLLNKWLSNSFYQSTRTWVSHFIALGLHFLICKMGIKGIPTFRWQLWDPMNDARHTVSNQYTVLVLYIITVEGMRWIFF